MRRFIVLLALISAPAAGQVEMTAATGGNVGIGTAPSAKERLRVVNVGTTNIVAGVAGHATSAPGQTAYGVYGSTGASGPLGGTRYAGYFAGNVYVTGTLTQASDAALKTDVRPLADALGGGALPRVLALRPSAYRFTADERYAGLNLPEGEHYGLVAQEVAEVLPALVREGVHPAGDDGSEGLRYRAVDYVSLVPVLVQALQEQQAQIEALRAEVQALREAGDE